MPEMRLGGLALVKLMVLKFQPTAAAADWMPTSSWWHCGSSHCMKTISLPFGGADFSGSVTPILVGACRYLFTAAWAAATPEPPDPTSPAAVALEEPAELLAVDELELLHAAQASARAAVAAPKASARTRTRLMGSPLSLASS